MWHTRTKVILIVIGALGEENLLTDYTALLGIHNKKSDSMQQTAVLGLAHILRKVLSIPASWCKADSRNSSDTKLCCFNIIIIKLISLLLFLMFCEMYDDKFVGQARKKKQRKRQCKIIYESNTLRE